MAGRRNHSTMYVNKQHLQLAKSIASIKGMSLKDYFGKKVEEDAQLLPKEIIRCSSNDEFLNWGKRGGNR